MLSIQNPSSAKVPVLPSSSLSWPTVNGLTRPVTWTTLLAGRRAGDGDLWPTSTGSSVMMDTVRTGFEASLDVVRVTFAALTNGSSAHKHNWETGWTKSFLQITDGKIMLNSELNTIKNYKILTITQLQNKYKKYTLHCIQVLEIRVHYLTMCAL